MKKKKNRFVRKRDWHVDHEHSFTHDLARHRKAEATGLTVKNLPFIPSENVKANGFVIGHSGQWAFVYMEGEERLCLLAPGLGERTSTVLAPGDEVQVELSEEHWVVCGVAPRRTKLSRLAHVYSDVVEQVLATNVDILLIVASTVQPRFKPGLVDRYMIAAEVGGVMPVLVLNKIDLAREDTVQLAPYRDLGLTVIPVSCKTGEGIEELRALLAGKLSVLSGHSGVGKSSILNAMEPSLELETQSVSAYNEKGRHTTSQSRLYMIHGDVRIIDTPGVRNLGLWNVTPEDVAYYFPELAVLSNSCRFRDCTHTHEPGCAVRAEVEAGAITRLRYESYLRIRESLRLTTDRP